MITLLCGIIVLVNTQSTQFEEIIVIAPYHYIQIGQVTGSTSKELFNAGTLTVTLDLQLTDKVNVQNANFSLALFDVTETNNNISRNYECLIDSLLYTPKINDTERICHIKFAECPQNMNQSQEMLYTDCNSSTNVRFTFYQENFNKLINSEQILVVINQNLFPISFTSTYLVDVKHRFSFYNLSLGLCIALGIVLILLLSLLCVLNYKYEKVKEENVRLNLVKGT